jgi:histidinol-phosphate/aromatic aminotransferase/cobyric acid decarboxylase-like protein
VPAKNIFIGNGATEIIQAVLHTFTTRKIIVNIPTFSPYYEFVKSGVEVVFDELNQDDNLRINIEKYIQLVAKEKPDTIVLINPNNPSGGYINLADIKYLVNQLWWVENIIIDESFIHFAHEDESYAIKSATMMTKEFKNLIIVKSMTKDFGIAGIRAGYAVMDKEKVNYLLRYGHLWNVSGLAEYFFRLYVQDEFQKKYEKVRIRYIQETKHLFSEIAAIAGLKVYPSLANFILVELTNGATSSDFVSKLLIKYGVYIRDCSDKIGIDGEFVRIASRTQAENEIIMSSVNNVLQNENIRENLRMLSAA